MARAYGFKCPNCGATLIGDWSFSEGPDCPICHPSKREPMRHDMDVPRGFLDPYAWPGGYTVIYMIEGDRSLEGAVYCSDCASRLRDMADPTDPPLRIVSGTHDEGPPEECAECGKELESSYGDPEATEESAP